MRQPEFLSTWITHKQAHKHTHMHIYPHTSVCISVLCVYECLYVWKQVFEEVLFQNLSMLERNIIAKQKRQAEHERRQEGIII